MREMSYWERESVFHQNNVAILGAGIVGLSAAIELRNKLPDARIVVLDRSIIPYGASTRNAGFVCFGSISELLETTRFLGSEDKTFAIVEKRIRGLQRLLHTVGSLTIDYEPAGGFEIFRAEEEQLYMQCLEVLNHYNDRLNALLGIRKVYRCVDSRIKEFGFKGVQHIIENRTEGLLNTGKLFRRLYTLATERGVQIFGGVEVETYEETANEVLVHTKQATFRTEKLLIATNGFARRFLPQEVTPARAQVLITKPLYDGVPFRGGFHLDQGYYYFRNVEDRVMLGGGRNLDFHGETTDKMGTSQIIQAALEQLLRETILPGRQFQVDMRWSGIMAVGSTKSDPPIVRQLSGRVFAAVRMGTMGVAIGNLIGAEAAEMIGSSL
ncbi:NAD(P)/FAD-dependent oxidoreductase [Fischerella sp. PCC 9605]|uniref:NAD(P)/FAD-dependent oxidoreductase n=1 Tax=Fischerella sp. PCC 9605 TaxID=1173024 RepID=UPI00047B4CE7|nr:FAD-dependent oxidoreductase [Fischerella sp. PCC 9605]